MAQMWVGTKNLDWVMAEVDSLSSQVVWLQGGSERTMPTCGEDMKTILVTQSLRASVDSSVKWEYRICLAQVHIL